MIPNPPHAPLNNRHVIIWKTGHLREGERSVNHHMPTFPQKIQLTYPRILDPRSPRPPNEPPQNDPPATIVLHSLIPTRHSPAKPPSHPIHLLLHTKPRTNSSLSLFLKASPSHTRHHAYMCTYIPMPRVPVKSSPRDSLAAPLVSQLTRRALIRES